MENIPIIEVKIMITKKTTRIWSNVWMKLIWNIYELNSFI